MVAAGLILLMFVGYGVYTLVKSSAASAPDVVVKQFFEVGGNRDLNGMMSLVDPAKSKEIEKVCKTYFINQGFGLGFTRVLDYQLVKNGDKATVTEKKTDYSANGDKEKTETKTTGNTGSP